MKTAAKYFLAISCVYMLVACSKSDDSVVAESQQSLKSINANGTGSISSYWVWDSYWQPVYCGDEMVDYLINTETGIVNVHTVLHLNKWNPIWENIHIAGVVKSPTSNEEFILSEHDRKDYASGSLTWHFNLIGNYGTHYIGSMTWDYINDPNMENLVVNRAICVEN